MRNCGFVRFTGFSGKTSVAQQTENQCADYRALGMNHAEQLTELPRGGKAALRGERVEGRILRQNGGDFFFTLFV